MCGRYNVTPDASAFIEAFDIAEGIDSLPDGAFYNISPSGKGGLTRVPTIRLDGQGSRELAMLHWPLIPFWSKDGTVRFNTANAKGETVTEKPAYRGPWRHGRRCLVPAHGYYEWQAIPGQRTKQPHHIGMPGGVLFAFGGLWDSWRNSAGDRVESCTIITTEPNAALHHIHPRMPLIVAHDDYADWLGQPAADAVQLIRPYSGPLSIYPVSTYVNNPNNDDPQCLAPLD